MLSTRYPFPVRKGDQAVIKTRLAVLSSKFTIDFVCFGKESERAHVLEKQYKNINFHVIPFSYTVALTKCFLNIFSDQPFQVVAFDQPRIKAFTRQLLQLNHYQFIHHFLIRSMMWSQGNKKSLKIMDAIDSMQLNLSELIKKSSFFIKIIYKIEKKRVSAFEIQLQKYFDQIWTIAPKDAAFFGKNTKIFPVCLDLKEYKSKQIYSRHVRSIIFSGNLNYYPNVDAILFFYKVFKELRKSYPQVKFSIAGNGWNSQLYKLKSDSSVIFLGEVENMNQTLMQADMAVCPMNLASGMQNKVIEAMVAGVPSVISFKAKGDLNLISETHCMIANNETEFLQHVLTLMNDHDLRKKLAKNARSYIESHHSLVNLSKGIFDAYEI